MRLLWRVSLLACLVWTASGQTAEPLPRFEGADVHPSPPISNPQLTGPMNSGGLYKLRFATLVDLIRIAYGVDAERVAGGPPWLELDHFDVIAKPPAGSSPQARRLMLQSLLADRFHLLVMPATRPMRLSELKVGQHVQLKRAEEAGQAFCGYFRPEGGGPSSTMMILRCRNMTMADFAEQIRNMARQGLFRSSLAVVDRSGLQGGWDFEFIYDPQLASLDDNAYVSQVLEKQVGLKLEDERIPAAVIEVQSVDRTPAPNPPDLAKMLPPPPTEFDAAEIKPADMSPDARSMSEFKNGRVYMPRTTVANLIGLGWGVSVEEVVGVPKWASTEPVDLVAKAPPELSIETVTSKAGLLSLDIEMMRAPLRALLLERYKMKVHTEERVMPAYALVAVKPKLEKADPGTRSRCHDGPPSRTGDVRVAGSTLGWLVTCENVTMAQFVEFLKSRVGGHAFDATGLEGAWQFSFNYYPQWRLNALAKLREQQAGDGATDPIEGYSIFDAVSKQLGLKLEERKHARAVLVIDEMER